MFDPKAAATTRPTSVFCISSYEKGQPFLREAARLGCEVRLLTDEKLRDADWPHESLTEFLLMPEGLPSAQMIDLVSYLARTRPIDTIVALDEFDLETAAALREHMQLPGMGQTATRFFRDKLAMRTEAARAGIAVPEFTGIFHYDEVRRFLREVPGPWLLKPRTNASAIGIRHIPHAEALWPILDQLGDAQSGYLLERFVSGDVFHVEGVSWGGELLFSSPFAYGRPPMETMHEGGVFTTRTLDPQSVKSRPLLEVHTALLRALHLRAGVTHSEFIRSAADGRFYFLETAARVGGAYIADVVEFASGLNPWAEWARIEVALARGEEYLLPALHKDFAGSVISLARQESPDLRGYLDAEVVMRLEKKHHAGLVVRSPSEARVAALVESYAERFLLDFTARLPAPEKPTA